MTRALAALPVLALGLFLIYRRYLTPSAHMQDYAEYYVDDTAAPTDGEIKVTFLGTTTLLFDDGTTQLMTDGFLTRPPLWRVALFKIATDPALVHAVIARLGIDRLKALFVSHSHYDHAFDVPYLAQRTGAQLHGSPSTLNVGRGGGLPRDQMVQFEVGKELEFGEFRVTVLNSRHAPAIPGINDDIGQGINAPLVQPARANAYREGGTYDILVQHRAHAILIKSSANYLPGALDHVRADVVFWALLTLGRRSADFKDRYYDESIARVKPKLIVPVHWDDFFLPLTDHLSANKRAIDDLRAGLDFAIARARSDGIAFHILQGYRSVLLFSPTTPS